MHRLAARLRLPRPAALGLAAPFARPARAAVTLASIAFGATAVIFAFGLTASLNRAAQASDLSGTVPVQVQPVGLGLAAPFARPARTAVSLAAIAFGATAVIFAFGLHSSLGRAAAAQTLSATVPVEIQANGPGTGAGPGQFPDAGQDAAVTAALRAQPGTAQQTTVYHISLVKTKMH